MKPSEVLLVVGLLLGLAGACETRQPIVVAVSTNPHFAPAVWTLERAARAGGVRGRAIEIVRVPDDFSGLEVADRLAHDDRVIAFLGHIESTPTLEIAPIFQHAGIPVLAPVVTASSVTTLGEGVYRTAPDDAQQARFMAEQLATIAPADARIAIVYPNTDYGRPFKSHVRNLLESRYEIVLSAPIIPEALSETAEQVRAAKVNVLIWLGDHTGLIEVLESLTATGERPALVVGGDLIDIPDLQQRPNRTLAGVYYPRLAVQPADSVIAAYRGATGETLGITGLLCYDVANLVLAAIREEGATREGVRRYVESLGRTRPPFAGSAFPIALNESNVGIGRFDFWQVDARGGHRRVTDPANHSVTR